MALASESFFRNGLVNVGAAVAEDDLRKGLVKRGGFYSFFSPLDYFDSSSSSEDDDEESFRLLPSSSFLLSFLNFEFPLMSKSDLMIGDSWPSLLL